MAGGHSGRGGWAGFGRGSARPGLRVRLVVARHRRLLAAVSVAGAVTLGLHAVRPAASGAGPTRAVLVAVRDLASGHRLVVGDLAERRWAAADVPAGVVAPPQGRVLGGALRRGEPVTDLRLAGRSGAGPAAAGSGGAGSGSGGAGSAGSGRVVVAVRLSDPASALVARAGEPVDVLAGPVVDPLTGGGPGGGTAARGVGGGGATVIVRDAIVLAVPGGAAWAGDSADGSAPGTSAGGGLLGAFTGGNAPGGTGGTGGAAAGTAGRPTPPPAGVVLVAVPPGDALQLAATAGSRALSLAGHVPPSA